MNSGIIFLDKPVGWTSRKAVNEVARLLAEPGQKAAKAGHAGTLDPLATGMLPILIGEATRFAELGLQAEKAYQVTFDLSYQTDTLDCEGDITERFTGKVDQSQLLTTLEQFRGKIQQAPPVYSAIRIDGQRAHERARKGESVIMQPRPVNILSLELIAFDFPLVTLDVHCSKGTYIRSLARDIGLALGMGGCVTMLRRHSTGGWPTELMVSIEQLEQDPVSCLVPLGMWLRDLPQIRLSESEARRFVQGQRIQLDSTAQGLASICWQDTLLGTGEVKAGQFRQVVHPARILPSAQRSLLS